jgi:hypothetical protein
LRCSMPLDTITLRPRCACTLASSAPLHKLFAPPADLKQPEERIQCKKSVQNPVQSEMPHRTNC